MIDFGFRVKKWWSSGAGDPRCKLYLVMGKSNPEHRNPYKQQSVVIVPAGNAGVTVLRSLSVYGYDGKHPLSLLSCHPKY